MTSTEQHDEHDEQQYQDLATWVKHYTGSTPADSEEHLREMALTDTEAFLHYDYLTTERFLSDAMQVLEQAQQVVEQQDGTPQHPYLPAELELRLRAKAAELQDMMEQRSAAAMARSRMTRAIDEAAAAKQAAAKQAANDQASK